MKITNRDGERLVPKEFTAPHELVQFYKHLYAYEIVKKFASSEMKALEVGFGSGYGTKFISDSFEKLSAIEVAQEAVLFAKENYSEKNVEYSLYDGEKIPFADGSFDLVFSHQVIEHVYKDDQFLIEASRVLKKDGVLIVTTPNRNYRLSPNEKPFNKFHIREYSPESLKKLLDMALSGQEATISGVMASPEAYEIEKMRVNKRARSWDYFNIRKIIPKRVKGLLLRLLRRRTVNHHERNFSLNDFYLDNKNINSSLDLVAIVRKS